MKFIRYVVDEPLDWDTVIPNILEVKHMTIVHHQFIMRLEISI